MSGRLLDTKTLKNHPSGRSNCFVGNFLNVNLKHIIEDFYLHIIPTTVYKDIMPYFDTFYTCIWLKSEYIVVPLKNVDFQELYNCQFWASSV